MPSAPAAATGPCTSWSASTATGQLWLLDCWRKQSATDEGVDAFLDLVKQWRPLGWACEKGQLANSIEPFMLSRQRQRGIYVAMEMFPTKGDKSVRCQSVEVGSRSVAA